MGVSIAGILVLAVLLSGFTLMTKASLIGITTVGLSSNRAIDLAGERARTELTLVSAEGGGFTLTVEVKNTGLISIYDYEHMDFIVDYIDTSNNHVITYLDYTTGTLGNNQWKKTTITPDNFEPNAWNPGETIALDALLSAVPRDDPTHTVAITTPNGISVVSLFSAKGFSWFTTANDISLSTTASWQDIDLSSYVPAGTTGAVVEVVNTGNKKNLSGVVRGKEDSRDYMFNTDFEEMERNAHRWQIVKVDSNLLIQGYIEDTDVDFKLVGYTLGPDPNYFTVPPDVTPATAGSWTPVDVSAYVDASADGVILFISSQRGPGSDYGVREVGSGFNTTNRELSSYGNTMYLVGIDVNDQFDVYIQDTDVKVFLVGETKGSVVYFQDDVAVADPSLGSWQEVDADDSGVPDEANGLIFWIVNQGAASKKAGLRHGDSTDHWNGDVEGHTHLQGASGIRADNVWDEYLGHADLDVSIAAYTKPLD